MSRVRNMVGWVVRGGDQTRADLAGKTAAIQELQEQVAELRESLESLQGAVERDRAEASGAVADVAARSQALAARLDRIDVTIDDHGESLSSMARIVARPDED